MLNHILTVKCPSRKGIIFHITRYLYEKGCNILDLSQFDDLNTNFFFMRVNFALKKNTSIEYLIEGFKPIAEELSLDFSIRHAKQSMKTIILVSRFDHCLNDLLYRWNIGTIPMNIVGVVSNHTFVKKLAEDYNIPFYHIPVTKDNKEEAEKKLIDIIENNGVELIVLARYMQILSAQLCKRMSGRIINIHHSFLPSFKGANPYKQAYEAGVKIIGATAHYVTPILDEGPIIEQDTVRITHAQNIEDYILIGRDIEAKVLSYAVNAHVQHRVFINKGKTIVFPASSSAYHSQ